MLDEAATSTNPTLVPNRADTDTGIGWTGLNTFNLITGGGDRLKIHNAGNIELMTTTGQLLLPLSNDATTPTLAFGDGDSGFYEASDDNLALSLGGSKRFDFIIGGMHGGSSGTIYIRSDSATISSTVPGYTFHSDDDTGIGRAGADTGSLIAGGANVLNWNSDGYVGIGTVDPKNKLTINVGSGLTDGIFFMDNNLTTYGAKILWDESNNILKLGGWDNSVYVEGISIERGTGYVGIGTTDPTEALTVLGNINQTTTGQSLYNSYLSGITGTGWSMGHTSNGSNLEVDNIIVRNTLRTHIFQKDVVKATNGILMVSDSGVIDYATATQVRFREDKSATFSNGTLVWYKDADADTGTINSVKFTIDSLVGTTSNITTYNVTYDSGTWSNIATGSTAVRFSGGTVVIDASSTYSPYIDVNASSGSAVVRMGNLEGITSPTFGALGANYGF